MGRENDVDKGLKARILPSLMRELTVLRPSGPRRPRVPGGARRGLLFQAAGSPTGRATKNCRLHTIEGAA